MGALFAALVSVLLLAHISCSSCSISTSQYGKTKVSIRKGLLGFTAGSKEATKLDSATKSTKIKKLFLDAGLKNKTKSLKPKKLDSSVGAISPATKIKLPKLNKTTMPAKSKATNLTKPVELSPEFNATSAINETAQSVGKNPEATIPSWLDDGSDAAGDDIIEEFRGLPARIQDAFVPEGVRPLIGSRLAPALTLAASAVLLVAPLVLLTALVRKLEAYLPLLRRALLFAQAYLAIYFVTLAAAALAAGIEPLRFFHAASPPAYAWAQVAQSMGYVAYLVLQLVDLVAAFGADGTGGEGAKALVLAQMVVGLAVGLHYYVAVFQRAVGGMAPLANWRVHAVYAACFGLICACARAERRKKAYWSCGGGGAAPAEDWKNS